MMLYVNGQDISQLVLALGQFDASSLAADFQVIPCGPESYLKVMTEFLDSHHVAVADLKGIVIVSGPGSPTALRASHAIVNTLAFTHNLSVTAIEKQLDMSDDSVRPLIEQATAHAYAFPQYGSAPKITSSPRDALKRKH